MTTPLARVRWTLGQTLLPAHLAALEDALSAEAAARVAACGLPRHGIAALRWSDRLLAAGVLSLQALTAVLPSGTLVDVPANGRVAPLDLNAPGKPELTAYLHLFAAEPGDGADVPVVGEVSRRLLPVALGSDVAPEGVVESLALGTFRKQADGVWALADEHVPPLLLVGGSPHLAARLARVAEALDGFEPELLEEAASLVAHARLTSARAGLKGLYRVRRLLAGLRGPVRLHPYDVYEALRDFLIDVALYREVAPPHQGDVYDHEALGRAFDRVVGPLCQEMTRSSRRAPYRTFERREGAWRVEVPEAYRSAQEVFLLVQKPRPDRAASLEAVKLAAASRLALVHRLALKGIRFERCEPPAAMLAFGPEVEFHVVRPGEEWDHALRDGAVAFYDRPELADLRFHLLWKMG